MDWQEGKCYFDQQRFRVLLEFCAEQGSNKGEYELGLEEFADKTVSQLSGGQKQRVAIGRAIVNYPEVLLADEPTGALDSTNAQAIMELFHMIHEKGTTVIIVTHDMELANQCDRKIVIADGCIVEE